MSQAATPPPDLPALVPARMLNEMAYCPRLFYIEWVDAELADNYYTVHGRAVHARSDEASGTLPDAVDLAEDDPFRRLRSVMMSSEREGLVAKIDVLELEGGMVEPVDLERGEPAPTPERAWEPERVQVCAQALILRDNGYTCERGWLYFAGSKERVEVVICDELVARARELLRELREVAAKAVPPPPLRESPKCNGCSLTSTSSGEVESCHRWLPQRRLKLPGTGWHPDTVNPMLALRVVRANGWWSDFWQERREMAAA